MLTAFVTKIRRAWVQHYQQQEKQQRQQQQQQQQQKQYCTIKKEVDAKTAATSAVASVAAMVLVAMGNCKEGPNFTDRPHTSQEGGISAKVVA